MRQLNLQRGLHSTQRHNNVYKAKHRVLGRGVLFFVMNIAIVRLYIYRSLYSVLRGGNRPGRSFQTHVYLVKTANKYGELVYSCLSRTRRTFSFHSRSKTHSKEWILLCIKEKPPEGESSDFPLGDLVLPPTRPIANTVRKVHVKIVQITVDRIEICISRRTLGCIRLVPLVVTGFVRCISLAVTIIACASNQNESD
jgi:hypothetical protein